MKKVIILFLLFVAVAWGQQKTISLDVTRPEFFTLNLDSTETVTVYYVWPPPAGDNAIDRTAISETSPTSASAQARNLEYNASGGLTISVVTDSVTADESDSVYAYIQTLIYDKTKETWYKSTNDTLFLDFDTPGTYTRTSLDYLDWTHGACYTVGLGGDILVGAGIAVTFVQLANDNTGGDANFYLGFWWLR